MSVIRNLLDRDTRVLHRTLGENERTIVKLEDKIKELKEKNEELRIVLFPSETKKRKLNQLDGKRDELKVDLQEAKQIKTSMETKIESIQDDLLEIDYRNCLTFFDSHKMIDVCDKHYGSVRYSQCERCRYIERYN